MDAEDLVITVLTSCDTQKSQRGHDIRSGVWTEGEGLRGSRFAGLMQRNLFAVLLISSRLLGHDKLEEFESEILFLN